MGRRSKERNDQLEYYCQLETDLPEHFTTYRLPEGQEDDKLDTQELEEWLVLSQIATKFVVELNQSVHGDRNTSTLESSNPDMGECWVEGVFTVSVCGFCDDRNDCEEYADEAVLEDAKINDLCSD